MNLREMASRLRPVRWPAAILGGAVLLAVYWGLSRPEAEQRERPEPVARVEVVTVQPTGVVEQIEAMGTVLAAQDLELRSEVAGRVLHVHPDLQPGGRVAAGTVLVEIDPADYATVVTQRGSDLAQARLNLALEDERKSIAEAEWRLAAKGRGSDAVPTALTVREPYLEAARAAVRWSEAALERARRDLARTRLVAPFDAVVVSEAVEEGTVVGVQARVATLAGTVAAHVRVTVRADQLPRVRPGAVAEVTWDRGGTALLVCTGRVARVLPDLEPVGRMARLLVEVAEPFGADASNLLALGAYVRVRIEGERLDPVYVLPRAALREGRNVWIVDEAERLDIRPVRLGGEADGGILVLEGLRAGERIVTTALPLAIPGMKLSAGASVSGEGAEVYRGRADGRKETGG